MDRLAGVKRVVVLMEQHDKAGWHKILWQCTLPLTDVGVVGRIFTQLTTWPGRLVLAENCPRPGS